MGHFAIETRIAAPVDVCFDAALDVRVHVESAAFSRETLVAPGKLEGMLQVNDLVCFEGRHFGVRQRFCARITEVERPRRFVDEMVEGTFKWLRHIHEFEARDGVTIMRDTLDWEAPLGVLGRIADALFLNKHMRWFVATKQDHLRRIVEKARVPRPEA